jgi:hypothetical protein
MQTEDRKLEKFRLFWTKSVNFKTAAVLIFVTALPVCAQETASLSGRVFDSSGAPVGGAAVEATRVESGAARTATTDTNGAFSIPQLTAGSFSVEVRRNGFATAERRGVSLTAGESAVLNFELKLGPITEHVLVTGQVSATAPVLDQTAGLVEGAQIRDLPLNGRSFDQLLTLNPGVANYSYEKNNNTPGISNSAVGNMFAVSGRRPQENLFLLDGVEYSGSAEINMTPSGTSGELLGVDAVQEFNVLTDYYSAQYGKRPGAQILLVSRSGSSEFHGSLYEFLRNSFFDARNFFDQKSVPQFQRNQFGASLGGPIAKHTFLFGNYEGFRQNLRLSAVTLVPDNAARAGILPDGRQIALSPRVQELLTLWPVQSPNSRLDSGGIAEAFSTPRQAIREDFGSTRLDQILGASDTLSAAYTVDDSADRTPTANPLALDVESLREQVASLRETHVFSPRVVNTATAGFSRASYFYTGEPGVADAPGFIAGEQVGAIVIGGSATPNTSSSITMAGSNNGSHLFATRNLFTYQDQVSIVKGRQQISAGVWYQRVQSNDELALGQYGQATFSNLASFLEGTVTTFTAVPSPTPLGWRSWEGAWFVEDQIRVAPNFTLSLGFRDEFTSGWNEVSGRAATFVFGPGDALETQPRISDSAFTVNRAKFLPQPRVGFGWNPAGGQNTVIRGAFGLYNDLQDALSYRLDQNAPFNTSITLKNLPLSALAIAPGNIPASFQVAPAGVQPDLFTPTVASWTLRFERALAPGTTFSLGYVGSHGYHETLSADLNQPYETICPAHPCPASYPAGTIYYPANAALRNPALASTWTWISTGNSSFNALEADLRRRFRNGVDLRGVYTWSKSLDNGGTLNASAAANAPGLAQNTDDLRNDWGPSTFDVRQSAAVSGIYELPFRASSRAAVLLLKGWSLNGVFSYNSGFPFTPQLSFNPSNNGNTTNPVRPSFNPAFHGTIVTGNPNQFFNPSAFVVPANGTYGNVGRDSFTGPGLVTFDFAVRKATRLRERTTLELRGEAFNILNHANFNTPNLIVYSSATAPPSGSAGIITSTSTTSRQIQVAAKLVW